MMGNQLIKFNSNSTTILYVIFFLFTSPQIFAQNVYKTPSGAKYHLSSCRMVENVSKKVTLEDIDQYNLTPCKICKPPIISNLQNNFSSQNKAVGKSMSKRCKGRTKKGTHCKHMTRLANGYCYQHTKQNSNSKVSSSVKTTKTISSKCGARTQSGGYCKRKVKGGGRCYQH